MNRVKIIAILIVLLGCFFLGISLLKKNKAKVEKLGGNNNVVVERLCNA